MKQTLLVAALMLAPASAFGQLPDEAAGSPTTGFQVGGMALVAPGGYLAGVAAEYYVDKFGFEVATTWMGYEYSQERYYENGGGLIVNARGRFYPMMPAQKVWLAGGLAGGVVTVYWEDRTGGGFQSEETSNFGLVPNFGAGWKFLVLDGQLAIDPQVMFGVVVGTDSENPFIAGAGASAGYRF